MAVHLTCPHCRRRLAVSRRHRGTAIACLVCGKPVAVPAAEIPIGLQATPPAGASVPPGPAANTTRGRAPH
jgi:hypothetical protein